MMKFHCNPRLARLSAAMLALAPFALGHANWETVPELRMTAEGDDNVLLNQADTTGGRAARTVLGAGVTFTNSTPTGEVFIEPRVQRDAYMSSGHDQFESTDLYFDAGGQRRGERVGSGFRAAYNRESVIRAELADVLPEDPDFEEPIEDIGTGRLDFFDQKREMYQVGGNLDFQLSERNVFRVDLQRRDVSYSGGIQARRSPFDDTRLALTLTRRVDERNRVSARMFVSQYNADRTGNTTDTVGMEGIFSRPLSEVWTFDLTAGVQRSDYSFIREGFEEVDNADATVIYGMGFRKRAQRSIWNVNLRHNVNPSSTGFLAVRDEARFFLEHQFTERLQGEFGARVSKNRTLDNVERQDDREYGRLEISFEWAMTPRLFLNSGYRFTAQRFVREENTTREDSNMIFLGMTYRGLSRAGQL